MPRLWAAAAAVGLLAAVLALCRVLAFTSHYLDWDHGKALEQARRALELQPHDSIAENWSAEFLLDMRRFDEALEHNRRAREQTPRWLPTVTVAGNIYLFSGHVDLAIAEYRRALEIDPLHGLANHFLGRAYLAQGHYDQAVEQLRRSNELLGEVPFSMGDLGYALAVSGRHEEAERLLSNLKNRREQAYYPAFAIAEVELGLTWMLRSNGSIGLPTNGILASTFRPSIRYTTRSDRIRDFSNSCAGCGLGRDAPRVSGLAPRERRGVHSHNQAVARSSTATPRGVRVTVSSVTSTSPPI
jgi:tetratricopeptide (TPR) repeat protein